MGSHTIRVSEEVYQGLHDFQSPRETHSDVVAKLLNIVRALKSLEPILAGQKAYHEWKQRQEGG